MFQQLCTYICNELMMTRKGENAKNECRQFYQDLVGNESQQNVLSAEDWYFIW